MAKSYSNAVLLKRALNRLDGTTFNGKDPVALEVAPGVSVTIASNGRVVYSPLRTRDPSAELVGFVPRPQRLVGTFRRQDRDLELRVSTPAGWDLQRAKGLEAELRGTVNIFCAKVDMEDGERKAKLEAERKAKQSIRQKALDALTTWEFKGEFLSRLYGETACIVGIEHRDEEARVVLSCKREQNMVLLVPEPDNEADFNAIMVFAWGDMPKKWHHVGYLPRAQAALMRSKWSGDFRKIAVARITEIPAGYDGHRGGRNIQIALTGELRTYPGYRAATK